MSDASLTPYGSSAHSAHAAPDKRFSAPQEGPPRRGGIGRALSAIPNLLALGALAAFGWWGHSHDWKFPKFSDLGKTVEEADDWCKEHGVPESICVECDDALLPKPKPKGWCKKHGVAECPLCHPDLAELKSPPAPAEMEKRLASSQASLDFAPRLENNPICKTHLRRIQFLDEVAVNKAGIAVEPVWTGPAVEFIGAPGEIVYDQTRVAHLSSRLPGSVWRVMKHLGDPVRSGELLALIDCAEAGKAKAELLQSMAMLDLKTQTLTTFRGSSGSVSDQRIREAEAAVREAQIRLKSARQALINMGLPLGMKDLENLNSEQAENRLHFLGLPADLVMTLDPARTTSNLLPLVSPIDGVIVSREVVAGEVVDLSRILFEVVDKRNLWIVFDVKMEESRKLKLGLPVLFHPDGSREEIAAKITWISSEADHVTRTVKVRADFQDREGSQKANTFGSGKIILRREAEVVRVPNDCVQWDGCCQVVFVRDKNFLKEASPKIFHVRKVRTAARDATHTEIAAGLLPGELVVTAGSGLLLTELLRGNLGEGCACHSKK
jgi:cobalt-zinc-cadmium efflux system membrane fusion protein